jgi:uncharacterized membrane protein YhhN
MVVGAFVVAAVLAVVDWVGVWRDDARLRWVGKPGVMVALIVAAAATDGAPSAVRAWFITALVLSLLGDVALLLPDRWFIAGLTSFLLAHLAYIAGMVQLPLEWSVGVLVVPVAVIVIAPTLVKAVRDTSPDMVAPVIAYLGVISGMAITAWCTSERWLIVAAMAFFTSDAMLGWGRFVTPARRRRFDQRIAAVAVMVTYHAAQACFVAWLATR